MQPLVDHEPDHHPGASGAFARKRRLYLWNLRQTQFTNRLLVKLESPCYL
jgi:hypothetical protein